MQLASIFHFLLLPIREEKPRISSMSSQTFLMTLLLSSVLVSCSTPDMSSVADRIQKTRMDNALYAKSARIRVWKDTSTHDRYGWHIHSEQENKFTLPENEFKTARYLVITHGSTPWNELSTSTPPLHRPEQKYIVELEWLNAEGRPAGAIDLPSILRESQSHGIITSEFPFVFSDEAYEQFFALPTVSKALDAIKE